MSDLIRRGDAADSIHDRQVRGARDADEMIYQDAHGAFDVVYRRLCKHVRRCRGPIGEYLVRDTRSGDIEATFAGGSVEDFAFDGRAHRRAVDHCMALNRGAS